MEKYTEMKFDGDLSFLNEHLEEANRISEADAVVVNENVKTVTIVQSENTILDKNYFEHNNNFTSNHTSQISANVQSDINLKNPYLEFYNHSRNKNSVDEINDSFSPSEQQLENKKSLENKNLSDVEDANLIAIENDKSIENTNLSDVEDAIVIATENDESIESTNRSDVDDAIIIEVENNERIKTASDFDTDIVENSDNNLKNNNLEELENLEILQNTENQNNTNDIQNEQTTQNKINLQDQSAEIIHNESSNVPSESFQNIREFNNIKDENHKSQFEHLENMENLRNNQSKESSQNPKKFNGRTQSKFDGLDNSRNIDNSSKLRNLDNVVGQQRSPQNNDEFNNYGSENRNQFRQSDKIENLRNAQDNSNIQNSRNFNVENHNRYNDLDNSQNGDNSAKLRNFDNLEGRQRSFQNTDDFTHNDRNYSNQFEQSEKKENVRNTQNNDSFQNSRNFDDVKQRRYNGVDGNQNMDNLAKLRSLDNFLDNNRGFQNTDENNSYERHNTNQFSPSGKIENARNAQNNPNYHNSRNYNDEIQSRFDGFESNPNLDNINDQRGYHYNDEAYNRDTHFRNQFGHSEIIENQRNAQNNTSFQNSRNFNNDAQGRFNDFDRVQNIDNVAQSRNFDNVEGSKRSFQKADEFNNSDKNKRSQFEQSPKNENLRNPKNNIASQNAGNGYQSNTDSIHNVNNPNNYDKYNNSYNRQDMQYMKNGNDIQHPENSKYTSSDNPINNAGYTNHASDSYRNNQIDTNNLSGENTNLNNSVNTYIVNDFEVVKPFNRRKSQLELMLINAGFDMELFNDFRDELLELEKDNIIMKYKQDLMMMILKS